MLLIILLIIIGIIVFMYYRTRYESKYPWQHFYDGFAFSANDFYAKVKAGLEERKITNISVTTESFLESHIFSDKREYLKITRAEYVFYLCAAPYGTGTFVSEWLCVKREGNINRIPIVSKLMGKDRNDKSFYQIDTEAMTRMAIHSTMIDVLNTMTTASGVRGLTELEAQQSNN